MFYHKFELKLDTKFNVMLYRTHSFTNNSATSIQLRLYMTFPVATFEPLYFVYIVLS